MKSHRNNRSRGLAAGAALSVALLAGCTSNGSSDDNPVVTPPPSSAMPTTTPSATASTAPSATATSRYDAVVNLTVRNGNVTGDTPRARVKKGQRVAIVVTSDKADEIHLHGYDKRVNVKANGTATLVFVATIPGLWTVELHSNHKELTKIQVS